MHATVREYREIENPTAVVRQVSDSFVPLIKEIPGFISYRFIDAGAKRMMSISVFETAEGTSESNRRAAEWVAAHPGLIPAATSVTVGDVEINA